MYILESMGKDEKRKSFVFYEDWFKMISKQNESVRVKIYDAICMYVFEGKEPADPLILMAFELIKEKIERDRDKFERIREKRREAINKRWGNSKNDSNDTNEYKCIQTIQMNTNDTENENENENENGTLINECHNNNIASPSKEGDVLHSDEGNAAADAAGCGKKVDYAALTRFWNQLVQDRAMAKIAGINENTKRRQHVAARVKEYGKTRFALGLKKASESRFLNGGGKNGRIFTFDWVVLPNNFPKVLEGNYDDAKPSDTHHDFERIDEEAASKPRKPELSNDEKMAAYTAWCKANNLDPNARMTGVKYFELLKKQGT
nr:MAG TPA: hypothetical protein [Caudoviricetes sp.]